MSNVIGFGEAKGLSGDCSCWLCQKPMSLRAIFCHACGTIQPVRKVDHFTRLGLEKRVDIDLDLLERQYQILLRSLDPQRFSLKGAGERGHATKQREAITEAYETLRDPMRRGRYWLMLHEQDFVETQQLNPALAEMRLACDLASNAAAVDRIAQQANQAFEDGIIRLLQSLRAQNWQQANAALVELDGMEGLLAEAREKRVQFEGEIKSGPQRLN